MPYFNSPSLEMIYQLKSWVMISPSGPQIFRDEEGREWDLRTVHRAPKKMLLSCDVLWKVHASHQPWGPEHPQLSEILSRQLLSEFLTAPATRLLRDADFSGLWNDHAARVALFVCCLEQAIELPPILIASDGTICDGYHRLLAYRLFGSDGLWAVEVVLPGKRSSNLSISPDVENRKASRNAVAPDRKRRR